MSSLKSLGKTVAYGALDVATAGRGVTRTIGGEQIRFPSRWSRYYESNYEPETFVWLRQVCQPGFTALDIGAHLGLFSVVMARLIGASGRLFSFEPTPLTNEVLRETIRLNNCSDVVEVRDEAVSRSNGSMIFFDTGDIVSNANSLVQTHLSRSEIQVDAVSIDEFVSARGLTVDCLKIDVEGAELDVLLGAQKTFKDFQPATRLALHPFALEEAGIPLRRIWDVSEQYGMTMRYMNQPVDKNWFCEQRSLFDVTLARASD